MGLAQMHALHTLAICTTRGTCFNVWNIPEVGGGEVVPLSDGNFKADVAIDAGRVHEAVVVGHRVDLGQARPLGAIDLPRHATPQLRAQAEEKEGRTGRTAQELKGRTDPIAAKS